MSGCKSGQQGTLCIRKYQCDYVLPPLLSTGHMAMSADHLAPGSTVCHLRGTTGKRVPATVVGLLSFPECVAISYKRSDHTQLYCDCPVERLTSPIERGPPRPTLGPPRPCLKKLCSTSASDTSTEARGARVAGAQCVDPPSLSLPCLNNGPRVIFMTSGLQKQAGKSRLERLLHTPLSFGVIRQFLLNFQEIRLVMEIYSSRSIPVARKFSDALKVVNWRHSRRPSPPQSILQGATIIPGAPASLGVVGLGCSDHHMHTIYSSNDAHVAACTCSGYK